MLLSTVKLSHWDVEIRSLAAKALGKLATLDAHLAVTNLREVMSQCMSSQPTVRHGSLLAVAEVVSALCLTVADSDASELYAGALSEEVVDEIVQLVPKLDKARMYRYLLLSWLCVDGTGVLTRCAGDGGESSSGRRPVSLWRPLGRVS